MGRHQAKHQKAKDGTGHITDAFASAMRRFGLKKVADKMAMNINTIANWVNKFNRATFADQRIGKIAKAIGFDGQIFE